MSRWARGITTVVAVLGLVTAGGVAAAQGNEHAAHGGGHSAGAAHAAAPHGGRSAAPAGHYAPRGGYASHGAGHYTNPHAGGASGYHGAAGGGHYYAGAGGWHGGGWHGSGWHGTGGYWHGHWWGGVYPLGVFFAALPLGYATYWWGGDPYYYANSTFYQWNIGAGQYETVAPPGEDPSGAGAGPAAGGELYVYPQQGQSDEQQRQDRYECYQWAAGQTGFDPTQPNGGVRGADNGAAGDAYRRAEGACLEGRGYTVR